MIGALLRDLRGLGGFLARNARAVVVASVATAVLVAAPEYAFGERHYGSLLYFGLLPLVVALCLGFRPRTLGLGIGSVRAWLPLTVFYLAVALPLLWIATQTSDIRSYYDGRSFDPLVSLFTISLYMIGWEFLFRGFLLFGLKDRLGEVSILVQMVPFTLMHLGKPDAETLSCIVAGTYWGYVCYRGDSFWPAVIMHVTVNYVNLALLAGYL